MSKIDSGGHSRREIMMAEQHRDFGDMLYAQMKNAPWVLCSVGIHGLLIGFLLLLPTDVTDAEAPTRIEAATAVEQVQLDEPEPVVEEDDFKEETEKVIEEPEITDTKVDETSESDDDMDTESVLGDPRFDSRAPFDAPGTNGLIGIGGGAGGPKGNGLGGRNKLIAGGVGRSTKPSVDMALEWLKNHQSPGGNWDGDGFQDQCKLNKCGGHGESVYDPGLTGLSLLCFLGAGETHNSGQYTDTVKNGLRYLKTIQDSEGCFGPRTTQHFQYNHMTAALAMTEAYGMTGSRLFRESAQRGVDFVHQSQNPYLAWRYGVRDGDNDTSVTGWAVMVLKSAKMADLNVDGGALRGAMGWIDKMTEPEFGRVGYQRRGGPVARTTEMMEKFPADQSEALTGVGVLTRIFAGEDPRKSEYVQKGADLMAKKPPRWDMDAGTTDFYYWYYATLAMFQVGGDHWKKWKGAMETAIVKNQRTEAGRDERGSWDPVDPWSAEGGRVYATALNCLSLEVYYRYGRVFGASNR
jgi:hypothetical protein